MECEGLCLRTANKPTKSLRLRVRGQINTGNTVVGVCNRLLDQDRAVKTFRQLEETSCLQILNCTGDSSNPSIC